jgi:hypothetical protein
MRTIAIVAAIAVLPIVGEPREARASVGPRHALIVAFDGVRRDGASGRTNSGAARPGAWQGPVLFVAASHFARPRRRETTTEYRIFEADQVFRETPESVLGKPIVTVGIASGSRLDVRVGPACRSLTHMGFALAGRF